MTTSLTLPVYHYYFSLLCFSLSTVIYEASCEVPGSSVTLNECLTIGGVCDTGRCICPVNFVYSQLRFVCEEGQAYVVTVVYINLIIIIAIPYWLQLCQTNETVNEFINEGINENINEQRDEEERTNTGTKNNNNNTINLNSDYILTTMSYRLHHPITCIVSKLCLFRTVFVIYYLLIRTGRHK